MNKAEAISTISQIAVDAIIKAPVNREEREAVRGAALYKTKHQRHRQNKKLKKEKANA